MIKITKRQLMIDDNQGNPNYELLFKHEGRASDYVLITEPELLELQKAIAEKLKN